MTRRFAYSFALLVTFCSAFAQNPAPTAPAAHGVTSTDSPEIAQFQKIENKWADAINMHDQYALELVLSPLFVDISASGDITTRNQQLAQVIAGEDKTVHLQQQIVTVRMLGDIVVANGTYTLHHKAGPSQVDEKGVFTHVFERNRSGWVCVNSQRTVLREDGPSTRKKKQSTADEPFHIPFFGKEKKD